MAVWLYRYMAAVKVTFALDEETCGRSAAGGAQKKPQSLVVREAAAQSSAREDKLTPEQPGRRLQALEAFRNAR